MRFHEFAVAVGIVTLGACAGGEKKPADTTHVAVDTSTTSASTTTSTTTSAGTSGAVAAAPATGAIHEVKMIGDAKGYRFEPANILVQTDVDLPFHPVGSFLGDVVPCAGDAARLFDAVVHVPFKAAHHVHHVVELRVLARGHPGQIGHVSPPVPAHLRPDWLILPWISV